MPGIKGCAVLFDEGLLKLSASPVEIWSRFMEHCCLAAFRQNKLRVGGISAQLLQSDSALQWGVEGWRVQRVDIIHVPSQQERVGKRRKRSRVGPSHGLQLFINCSGVGSFPHHEMQSMRKRLLQPGVICGLQCGYLLPYGPPQASGRQVFSMGCSRISAAAPGSLSFPPYPLPGVSAGLFLSHFSYSSSSAAAQCFLLYLGYIITEPILVLVMGTSFEQQRVCFGIEWDWLSPAWEQLLLSSYRATFAALCHHHLAM